MAESKQRTFLVPGSQKPGSTGIYRNPSTPNGFFEPTKVQTLYENFQRGVSISADRPCLGTRIVKNGQALGYEWLTYAQVQKRFTDFGSGLLNLHAELAHVAAGTNGGWHVGIYSINRTEWIITEQAANAYSVVTVALYDTLGADTLAFTVNHAELPVVVASADKIPNLLQVAHKCPGLKIIISMDELAPQTSAILCGWAKEKNIQIYTFAEVEALGKKKPHAHLPPKGADLATICYTSGTTGEPKGALIRHKNFVSCGHSIDFHGISISHEDVMISYLPLAHCFERALHVSLYNGGGSIGFYRGDVLLLVDDIAALRPTVFPSVPRLFNRIYAKLIDGTLKAPGVKGMLCRTGYAAKVENLKSGQGLSHFFWDRLLFGKVAAVLGGRVRIMITGSAPISAEVLTFLRLMFSCEILEGYGQTENSAGSTITFPGDYVLGQVGSPLACNEIKLVDVPEMNYLSTDTPSPRGEVCIRGSNVMSGYYKDSKKTAETIDEEGWLHTGDIGKITPTGTLAIIDRKKNIFKLAQGEYVAPEKLEIAYQKNPYVLQTFVHGDSLQSELVAVIIPEPEKLFAWANKHLEGGSFAEIGDVNSRVAELVKNPKVKQFYLTQLQKTAKQFKFAGFEMIKDLHLESEPFSIENDMLTPSFKLKRNIALAKYRAVIDELYKNLALKAPPAKL